MHLKLDRPQQAVRRKYSLLKPRHYAGDAGRTIESASSQDRISKHVDQAVRGWRSGCAARTDEKQNARVFLCQSVTAMAGTAADASAFFGQETVT